MWQAAWHFIASSASVATLIGCGALAVAILEPKFLDAITDLRKWAIVVAAVAFSYTAIAGKFYNDGLREKQREWNAALARETVNGEKARSDAVVTIGPVPPDRSMFSGDKWNRDAGKHATKSSGPVRWLAGSHLFGR